MFGSGISAGDVALGSSLLGLLSGAEDEDITDEPVGETNPDYEGIPYKGLFVDPDTGIAYDTIEELEDAVNARKNLASGGIVALKEGGTATREAGYIEGLVLVHRTVSMQQYSKMENGYQKPHYLMVNLYLGKNLL